MVNGGKVLLKEKKINGLLRRAFVSGVEIRGISKRNEENEKGKGDEHVLITHCLWFGLYKHLQLKYINNINY